MKPENIKLPFLTTCALCNGWIQVTQDEKGKLNFDFWWDRHYVYCSLTCATIGITKPLEE